MNITYPALSDAINATGRPMWLSCSWPCYVGGCGGGPARVDPKVYAVLQDKCNTWRDFNDMYDNQDSLYNIIGAYTNPAAIALHNAVIQPGAWNDPDMLGAGGGGLSTALETMQVVMWAMLSAPMIMSNDLPNIAPESKALLLNSELLAVNQDVTFPASFNVTDDHTYCKNMAGGAIALAGIHQTSLGPPTNITLSPNRTASSSRLSTCLLPSHAGVTAWKFRDVLRNLDLAPGSSVECLAAQPGSCLVVATPLPRQRPAAPRRALPFPFFGANMGAAMVVKHPEPLPAFVGALSDLGLSTIRFPSGTYGNWYNWSSGEMLPPYAPTAAPTTLADLAAMLKAAGPGTRPIFMLNMLTMDVSSQLAMLRAARAMGLDTSLVELGNEFYLQHNPAYAKVYPTGAVYGRAVNAWVTAIRAEFPASSIAIITTASAGGGGSAWNTDLFSALAPGLENLYATMHEYHPSGLSCAGCPLTPARAAAMVNHTAVIAAQMAAAVAALPPSVAGVWVTEWSLDANGNATQKEALVYGTWAEGLFCAALALRYVAIERVVLMDKHALIGDATAGQLFSGADDFNVPGTPNKSLPTTPWTRTASGWSLGLLGDAAVGATTAAPVALGGAGAGAAFFLPGGAARGALLNGGAAPLQVAADALAAAGLGACTTAKSLSADPTKGINNEGAGAVAVETAPVASSGVAVTLPPWSVTLLS